MRRDDSALFKLVPRDFLLKHRDAVRRAYLDTFCTWKHEHPLNQAHFMPGRTSWVALGIGTSAPMTIMSLKH